jgi:hypothetical protein
MDRKLLLSFGLLGACSPALPCSGDIPYTEGACVVAPAPDSKPAWDFIGGRGSPPAVHLFSLGDCDSGKRIMAADRSCVYGITYDMDVYVGPADWRTSLAHEFFHVVLGQETGDRDPDHTNPDWSWLPVEAGKLIP